MLLCVCVCVRTRICRRLNMKNYILPVGFFVGVGVQLGFLTVRGKQTDGM